MTDRQGLQKLGRQAQATRGEIKRFKELKDAKEIFEASGGVGRASARRTLRSAEAALKRAQGESDRRRRAGKDLQPPLRRRHLPRRIRR